MNTVSEGEMIERELPETGDPAGSSLINASEINQQIATARRYPRSLKAFRDEALQMVTLNESVAQECIYALPRDGKIIEGPSARMAEVLASAWGNCRAGARVIDDRGDFVTAQGGFHDLQKNVCITYEVQRRIVDKNGRRYKPDMIGVTANAACSIALRNAILKGIPKAFWNDIYQAARKVIMGDFKTLSNRRAEAIKEFQAFGVNEEMIYGLLEVKGKEDVTIEQLVVLRGLLTAIKEGDTTVEQAFGAPAGKTGDGGLKPYPTEAFDKNLPTWLAMIEGGKSSPEKIITMISSKGTLTDAQKAAINGQKPTSTETTAAQKHGAPTVTFAIVKDKLQKATELDLLDAHADLIAQVADKDQREELTEYYKTRRAQLEGGGQ